LSSDSEWGLKKLGFKEKTREIELPLILEIAVAPGGHALKGGIGGRELIDMPIRTGVPARLHLFFLRKAIRTGDPSGLEPKGEKKDTPLTAAGANRPGNEVVLRR